MRLAWIPVVALLLGVGVGWGARRTTVVEPESPPAGFPSERAEPAPSTRRQPRTVPRPCPEIPEAALELLRRERELAEMQAKLRAGQRSAVWGPSLQAVEPSYEPEAVRPVLERILKHGKLEYRNCTAYPCTAIWNVEDVDLEVAERELLALREAFPGATTNWYQAGVPVGFVPDRVPIILHEPYEDVSAEWNDREPMGRVRFISRLLAMELGTSVEPERWIRDPELDDGSHRDSLIPGRSDKPGRPGR